MTQNTPPTAATMSPEENDLFSHLINYDEEYQDLLPTNTQTQQPAVTFLESHTDLSAKLSFDNHQNELFNMNNENLKKMMSDHGQSNPDTNLSTYRLDIVEQPQQCRMSGYGEKDRRPIDPAPIIRLIVVEDDAKSTQDPIENPFYIIHASLWSVDMTKKHDIIEGTAPHSLRFLIGSLVSSPALLKDLDDERAYYFSFPDLSVRMTGQYRLQFSLMHLARNKIIQEVFSDPFTVYSAKSYPGMKESSLLSRHLAKQGLKLTVRKQVRPKKDEK